MKWKVAGKKNYLLKHYVGVDNELVEEKKDIMKAKLEPRNDDPEGYVTLTTMLLDCWRLKDVQEGD